MKNKPKTPEVVRAYWRNYKRREREEKKKKDMKVKK
jgi:hypothetical protein